MKKMKLLVAALVLSGAQSLLAQDNNDTNIASHILDVNVPEVALLDIFDANTGTEASAIMFDMTNVTLSGTNAEAGLYAFQDISYSNLFLNYTSVVASAANTEGYDLTRKINVKMEAGSTFPGNLDLRISPEAPVIISDGGTADSAGTIMPGGVALGVSVPIGTDALLVDSIESVYTGDQEYGVKLTYTLEQNGNFASYNAGSYQSTLVYTLTDL
ncbi:hypothetical protein [Christiangramia flava]|uniref:Uncharacterized protein n=2 Tax=Flavobacteriaceae TaxID=49546 RepID=A0A1L7I795_9FLAO|nr:hypothetical protein [Christiangramia flava]APU69481.1 hypothetical protein GRFL_2757 [Christiangramia flava JLT2011]OSS37917.1 hypothetical protein C723_3196 [Christiangramia flava JLT2011]